jgi:hypothetical protein
MADDPILACANALIKLGRGCNMTDVLDEDRDDVTKKKSEEDGALKANEQETPELRRGALARRLSPRRMLARAHRFDASAAPNAPLG